MRTLDTQARKFRSTVGKIVVALVFASMIGVYPSRRRLVKIMIEVTTNRREAGMSMAGVGISPMATTRQPSMSRQRSSMSRTLTSHRASASSSPSAFDRGLQGAQHCGPSRVMWLDMTVVLLHGGL